MTPQSSELAFAGVGGIASIFSGVGQIQSGQAQQ